MSKQIAEILANYDSENPGVKANLYRMLNHGKLAGTGKMVILPVDQGFEHGPDRSFAKNEAAYDPHYHYQLAIDAGLNAYAAPFGMLSLGASKFAGQIPTILKMNSANSLLAKNSVPYQAITATIQDALELGCSAIGFTIYPGSDASLEMFTEIAELSREAKSHGLAVVIWSYARGGDLDKKAETALDVISYAAHMAALLGAHIIKVKPPTAHIHQVEYKDNYQNLAIDDLAARIAHIKKCCFNGRRIVIFSGGVAKGDAEILAEIKAINDGGGNGSIIGRNSFQRPYDQGIKLLNSIIDIYNNRK